MRRLAVTFAALLSATAAQAQETTVEAVTVPGRNRSLEERVSTFVRAAVVKEIGQSLIRWRKPICPLVAGLPAEQGEFVLQRISQAADLVGAPLGGADCRPNIYVVVTHDPKALLATWRRRDSNLFGHQLPARINRFIDTDRPVRVWHNWAYDWADAPDKSSLAGNWRVPPTGARVRDPSRLADAVVRNDWGAVVVIDAKAVDGFSVGQLAAYVAMTVLTEFDLDAELGDAPTILRLFETGAAERPIDLSSWDVALLRTLYGTRQELYMQRQIVASRVARDVAP
jgi:hypothetical protein